MSDLHNISQTLTEAYKDEALYQEWKTEFEKLMKSYKPHPAEVEEVNKREAKMAWLHVAAHRELFESTRRFYEERE